MKSATDAFEDAEIAREEGMTPRAALLRAADLTGETVVANWLRFHARMPIYDSPGLQSPASTTAADAWDEGAEWMSVHEYNEPFTDADRVHNPHRVLAPEGDGGNE